MLRPSWAAENLERRPRHRPSHLSSTKLSPGQSTDGAIFFLNSGKLFGAGKLTVNAAGEIFEFPVEIEPHARP